MAPTCPRVISRLRRAQSGRPLYPDSDRIADIAACLKGAKMRYLRTMPHLRADEQLRKIGDVSAAMYWSAADPAEYRSS